MKARRILLWIVCVPFALYAIAYAVRFQTTLPIEGVVVDAKTGRPVSKVLVHSNWLFSYPNLVDTTSGGFGFGTATGDDGTFRIPRKNVTSVVRSLNSQSLIVKHPLYDFVDQQVYVEMYKKYNVGTVENGVLKITIAIVSLEDKYSRPEDVDAFARVVDNSGPEFFQAMKDNFRVRYDLNEIRATLETIASRFGGPDYRVNHAYRAYLAHELQMEKFRKNY